MSNPSPEPPGPQPEAATALPRQLGAATVIVRLITGQLALAGALVLTGIITARVWGADARGLIAAVVVWPRLMISVAQSGISKAIPVVMKKNEAARVQVAQTALKVWLFCATLGMLISAALIFSPVTLDAPRTWQWWAILMVPAGMLVPFGKGILMGLGDPTGVARMNGTQGLVNLATVATVALLLGLTDPYYAYFAIAGFTIGYAVNAVPLCFTLLRASVFSTKSTIGSGDLVRQSAAVGAGSLCTSLVQQLNLLMLTLPVFGVAKADIANYTVAFAFAMLLRQVPQAASGLVTYRGSQNSGEAAFAKMTATVARRSLLVAMAMMIPLASVSPWLVPAVYGEEFGNAGWLTLIALPGIVGLFLSNMYEAGLAAQGRSDLIVRVSIPLIVAEAVLIAAVAHPTGIWGVSVVATSTYLFLGLSMAARFSRLNGLGLRQVLVPGGADAAHLRRHLATLIRRFKPRSSTTDSPST